MFCSRTGRVEPAAARIQRGTLLSSSDVIPFDLAERVARLEQNADRLSVLRKLKAVTVGRGFRISTEE